MDLTTRQLEKARDIIREDPSLIWYTKAYDRLDIRSIVEAVLNHGSWEQMKQLEKILGVRKLAEVFAWHEEQSRNNLHPMTRHYYSLYFGRHVPGYTNL